jgi:hypothetical protein
LAKQQPYKIFRAFRAFRGQKKILIADQWKNQLLFLG